MKEKIKKNWKWIKWILIALIIYAVIYLIYPKYYFISSSGGELHYRCNKITGQCENQWGNKWGSSSWVKKLLKKLQNNIQNNNDELRENYDPLEEMKKRYKEWYPTEEK